MTSNFRVVGVGFDHMHIGDQLATALAHPDAEIVGVWDRDAVRAQAVLTDLGIDCVVYDDVDRLIAETAPNIAFLCSTTAEHAELVERFATAGVHVIIEKPLADSPEAATRIAAAASTHGVIVATNWPLAWVASHRTLRRLIGDGRMDV